MERARILIVGDESVVLGVRASLEKLGYRVVGTAANAEDAVRIAREHAPDLLLVDILLGGGADGVATAELVRRETGVPVVFLTPTADAETVKRAADANPFGFLRTPLQGSDAGLTIGMALLRSRLEKKLNVALEEVDYQRGFFEALFDINPNGILVMDAERRVYAANQSIERMFGVGSGQLLGRRIGDVLNCTRSAEGAGCGENSGCGECRLLAAVTAALSGSQVYRNHAQLEWNVDGKRQRSDFLVSARSVDYRLQRLAAVVLEDVTELSALRSQASRGEPFAGMIGRHWRMREVFDAILDVAWADVPVLVLGESGTGKELVARAIHDGSRRAGKAFVPVNCGALPEGLLESELFGHVRGAFTGAIRDKKGRFELADGGTIFLDEIGDLAASVQVKLLRVLQEGTFERVGSESTQRVDARVISATHKNLREEMAAGRFREDLFYRLSVVPISLPPLRERADDIPLLAAEFLKRYRDRAPGGEPALGPEAVKLLMGHSWPGNVRELQNALQYAMIKAHGQVIGPEILPPALRALVNTHRDRGRRHRLTRERVQEALLAAGGSRVLAAGILGVSRATLYRFLSLSGG